MQDYKRLVLFCFLLQKSCIVYLRTVETVFYSIETCLLFVDMCGLRTFMRQQVSQQPTVRAVGAIKIFYFLPRKLMTEGLTSCSSLQIQSDHLKKTGKSLRCPQQCLVWLMSYSWRKQDQVEVTVLSGHIGFSLSQGLQASIWFYWQRLYWRLFLPFLSALRYLPGSWLWFRNMASASSFASL